MEYRPADQSIEVKSPETWFPLPISILTNPFAFVAVVCAST